MECRCGLIPARGLEPASPVLGLLASEPSNPQMTRQPGLSPVGLCRVLLHGGEQASDLDLGVKQNRRDPLRLA